MATLKVDFPQKQKIDENMTLTYNKNFTNNFNVNLNKVQAFLDNKVVIELQKYVSKKKGVQEKSIRLGTVVGSGIVKIDVPYAEVQAYSKRIKKRNGLRGTRPWERMVADKKKSILKAIQEYSKGLNK